MQKYTDVVTSARSGAAIPSARVLVKTHPGAVDATIYEDNESDTKANPLTTDANGEFSFKAADGDYTLTVSGTGITERTVGPITLLDPGDGDDTTLLATDVSFTPSGSGLVETTVHGAIEEAVKWQELEGRYKPRLRAVFEKMFTAYAGTLSHVKGVAFGDSVGKNPWVYLAPYIHNAIGATTTVEWQTSYAGDLGTYAGVDNESAASLSGDAPAQSTGNYTYFPTGQIYTATESTSFALQVNGSNPTFTKAKLYYFKEVGGDSSVEVYVGGVLQETLDASLVSGGPTLAVYEFDQSLAQAQFRIDVSAGVSFRFLNAHFINEDTNGLDLYQATAGGAHLQDGLENLTSRDNLQTYLEDIAPDIFTFEMKEEAAYLEDELDTLATLLDDSIPNADKVFFGSTPMSNASSDADQRQQNAIVRAFCATNGYTYFDKYAPFMVYGDGTTAWTTLNALGWGGDGTHPSNECHSYTGLLFVKEMQLDAIGYGYTPKAVNDRVKASRLAKGTTVGLDGVELEFDVTGGSNDNDWEIIAPRSLTFIRSSDAAVMARFYTSANAAVARFPSGTSALAGIGFEANGAYGLGYNGSNSMSFLANGTRKARLGSFNELDLASNVGLGWSSATDVESAGSDTSLFRGGVGVLRQRSSTTAQSLEVYATYLGDGAGQWQALRNSKTTLSAVSGATVTATNLIPVGAFLVGVTTRINTTLGTSNGTTGYSVGDGVDADRWGAVVGTTAGVDTDNSDATADATGFFTATQSVVITATTGDFDGTGAIEVTAHYLTTVAG